MPVPASDLTATLNDLLKSVARAGLNVSVTDDELFATVILVPKSPSYAAVVLTAVTGLCEKSKLIVQ